MKFYINNGMIRSEKYSDYGTKSILIDSEHADTLSAKLSVNCIKHKTHIQGKRTYIIAQLRREDDELVMNNVIDRFLKSITI